MAYQSYQESEKKTLTNELDRVLEELDIRGYAVVERVLPEAEAETLSQTLDAVWQRQCEEYDNAALREAGERGVCRALISYDMAFARLIRHPLTLALLAQTVGETAILHLINGIIAFPNQRSNQVVFHRDFAKPFSSDKLLSINTFWLLDAFTPETGATWFLPHTQQISYAPSDDYMEQHAEQVTAPGGSVVIFDSRIYHRGGDNTSLHPRRAINLQYTRPFIKQQINLAELMQGRVALDSPLAQTLGMWSVPPPSLKAFHVPPEQRTYRRGQG